MQIFIQLIIGFVAFLHLYFLWLEMFAWTTKGPKVFRNFDKNLFEPTKALAANQGLYNGFLSAGLLWTFFIDNEEWSQNIAIFFLSCVAVAGIYGALTASKKIFYVQALPALIGLILILAVNFL
jgi:putative membrane protein